MTKIYEALDSAGKERAQTAAPRVNLPGKPLPKGMMDKLVSLYQRLETIMEERRCSVIAFAGGQQGDDSAKLLCETAKLAAGRLNRRILLISADGSPVIRQLAPGGSGMGWDEMAQDGVLREELFQPVSGSSLYVSTMSGSGGNLAAILSSPLAANVFDALRQRFDMILIAAPALDRSSDTVMLAPLTDGVVLVINAGNTRWQVAKRWIDQIAIHKGKVVGVLFNKRRDYIPYFIYSRL